MSIRFFNDGNSYRLEGKRIRKKWINSVIENEGYKSGEINIIFTDDRRLRKINKKFLDRSYLTDVITFDYSSNEIIKGEIFISIEAVQRNSKMYQTTMKDEIDRVIIHGVLHMTGEKDQSKRQKARMHRKEDQYLRLRN